MSKFSYEIIEELGTLKECNTRSLLVNIISFNGGEPKLDIRWWNTYRDEDVMGKGVALGKGECEKLLKILEELHERDN